ncbi:Wzz/FepE/Etk N-terminal domain-containing protein [Aquabacterium sp.]|uniref:Wzz/FepE/Etk N-terminal domain-containing protein n=1 Tax=Aquabacterium sp. TaxID=1872578 RepID=UPI0035AE8F23
MTDMRADNGTEGDISLLDLLLVIKNNIKLLLVGPLSIGIVALGCSFLITPTYTATTTFLPPQQQQSSAAAMLQGLGALGSLAGAAAGIKNATDQYVSFAKSRSVQEALVKQFDLKSRYKADFTDDALKTLAGNAKVTAGKDGLISIDVDDTDPVFAAKLANAHIEQLNKLLDRLAVTDAQQRRMFYERQLANVQTKLKQAQSDLQRSGIKEGALRAEPRAAAEAYAALKAQVTAAEVALQSMRAYLTDQSPELRAAQANLGALRSQLSKAEAANNAAADDDYIAKYRDFKYQETLFEMFAKQFELAKLDEAKEGALIQVVDEAQPPERKSKPMKALIAVLATLISGFFLLIYVFIKESWRKTIQSGRNAEKMELLLR